MCGKIYIFKDKNGNDLYLNGSGSQKNKPEIMIKLYVKWYNKDFAPLEKLEKISVTDFKFITSFCPIDFYDESSQF